MNRAAVVAVLCVCATVSACSVSVGSSGGVDRTKLEQQVSSALTAKVGQTPKSVVCPNRLDGKVDAVTRCTLTAADDTQYGLTVTVTSVEGSDVRFAIKVDDHAKTS